MPYVKDNQQLDRALADVLTIPDIRTGLRDAHLSQEELTTLVRDPQRSEQLWQAAARDIAEYERFVDDSPARLDASIAEASKSAPWIFPRWSWAAITVTSVVYVITVISTNNIRLQGLATPLGLVALLLGAMACTRIIVGRKYLDLIRKQAREADRQKLAEMESRVEEALRDGGVAPFVREEINIRLADSYETTLSTRDASGMAEVFDPRYGVRTPARDRLERLLEGMPGGSIGIAGPRGAGKTTLLRSFCDAPVPPLKTRPVVATWTSAPVHYDAREFILHVYALLCRAILEADGGTAKPAWRYLDDGVTAAAPVPFLALLNRVLGRLSRLVLVVIGIALIAASLLLASHQSSSERTYVLVKDLGITAPGLLASGVTAAILGLVTHLLLRPHTRREADRERGRRDEQTSREQIYSRSERILGTAIARAADESWRQIKFQQTYTSGWSGALKFPFAAEASANAGISMVEKQQSLPDVIREYRDFIAEIAKTCDVIIGIDELDKIDSDKQAQTFVNDLKALFGIQHCFYLLSISESAMSTFERRGLPFRDAFDSALDAVVYVTYLNLTGAKTLLRPRVVGLSVPFVCLCHCLCGGLARDLIRVCRDLLQLGREFPGRTNLPEVCAALIEQDLRAKFRALAVTARDVLLAPPINRLRTALTSGDPVQGLDALLHESYATLLPNVHGGLGDAATATMPPTMTAPITPEFGVYLYYLVTILEFFSADLNETRLKDVEASGDLDLLVRSRQTIGGNTAAALFGISTFRASQGLRVPEGIQPSNNTGNIAAVAD